MAFTITSANAILMLGVAGVFPSPVQIQGFGVDDAFTTEMVDASETQVGVDGIGVAGFVPRAPEMTIRLLASSTSFILFEQWIAAQDQLQDVLYANGIISLPSVRRKYTMAMGALMRVSTLPDARRVLANREFHIRWLPQGPGVPAISSAPL